MTDAFARWINEDPPGTTGTSADTIGYGIAIVVGLMIVIAIAIGFQKRK